MSLDIVFVAMSTGATPVPSAVRWLLVLTVLGLVIVAAFWRPESVVKRSGPLGILEERTWVEGIAYGALALTLLYGFTTAGGPVSPLFVPIFVISIACVVEAGQSLSGVTAFQPVDLLAAAGGSTAVALVWDAGQRAIDSQAG